MRSIIVDDEFSSRAIIEQYCKQTPDVEVLASFEYAVEAMKFLSHTEVDVIFLDIHMPGFTGIDFIQMVKEPPLVVLITSDKEYAIQAYEYEKVADFLLKPIQKQRFDKAISKVRTLLKFQDLLTNNNLQLKEANSGTEQSENNALYINIDRRLIKIYFDDILLIQAKGDYIHIKTTHKEYRVHTTLKKIYSKLPLKKFIQVHRSYIINYTKIIDIEDNSVLIEKNVIPISRNNRSQLMKKLNLL